MTKGKQAMKDAEKLIKKYQEQQTNVRNNREFEAISKEIESQEHPFKELCPNRPW